MKILIRLTFSAFTASMSLVLFVSASAQTPRSATPATPQAAVHPDISGFWGLSFDGRKIPAAKLLPGVTRAALDLHARRDVHAIRWCNLLGTPAIMDSGRPLDIRQGSSVVIITPETTSSPRYLYFRAKHVDADTFDPATNGDSIATWQGDTLVVDTVGFHPTRGITSIPGGGFKTERSHLVERYRLLENGAVLSVTFTWTDPRVFRTPHTYEFRYSRLPPHYEAIPAFPCDPYNEARAQFIGDPAPFNAAAADR
jgi:hypothetical protein